MFRRMWVLAIVLLLMGACNSGQDRPAFSGWQGGEGSKPLAAPAPASLAKDLSLDLGGGVSLKLVLIPAGEFMMGSGLDERNARVRALEEQYGMREEDARSLADPEGPQHRVKITRVFYMGIYEVTQEQYEAVMGTNPSWFKGAKNPVGNVSWDDAQGFCKKLTAKLQGPASSWPNGEATKRVPQKWIVRLPTEAEWEYACRAGTTTQFSFGDSDAGLSRYANYADANAEYLGSGKAGKDGFADTAPVGSFQPNAWGLYDMHGNVREWCQDWYDEDYYGKRRAADPKGPETGTYRVLRGGSCGYEQSLARSADRGRDYPCAADGDSGFRVVVAGQ